MTNHVPVLLEECLALLAPQDGRAYMDCTFGGGGHTAGLLDRAPVPPWWHSTAIPKRANAPRPC